MIVTVDTLLIYVSCGNCIVELLYVYGPNVLDDRFQFLRIIRFQENHLNNLILHFQ